MIKQISPAWMIVLFVAGCTANYKLAALSHDLPLEQTHWVLTTLKGQPAIEDGSVRQCYLQLSADDLSFHAGTGMNGIGGTYTLNGRSLRFTLGISTQMAGSDEAMAQERAFKEALAATQTYRIDGRELQLKVDDEVEALFVAQ